jgi:putative acetyltransferase
VTVGIRQAGDGDTEAILHLLREAFGSEEGDEVAGLVGELLVDPTAQPLWSLVAVEGDQLVGHVLFTHVELDGSPEPVSCSILAPLAVRADRRNTGIGGLLIKEGLDHLRRADVGLVFVLGHPEYYPRYGFAPAGEQGYEAPYPIAPLNAGAWMVQPLRPGALDHTRGRVHCCGSLNEEKYWVE